MDDRIFYFAYGSNMAIERIRSRISSANLMCVAVLDRHRLKFHKPSKDGSGKCDAAYTGNPKDKIFGALYSIQSNQLQELDRYEGHGYERKTVTVHMESNKTLLAETYIATQTNPHLRPLDWYKEHVIRGAIAIALPSDYIDEIQAIAADVDLDEERRTRELAIYG